MFYTGLDPYTMEEVYVAKTPHDKALQRALLQYYDPKNRDLVEEALRKSGRHDLIGYSEKCLIQPKRNANNINKRSTGGKRYEKKKKY